VVIFHEHRTMFLLSRNTESLLAFERQGVFTEMERKLEPKPVRTVHVFDHLEIIEHVDQRDVNWRVVRRLLTRKVRGTKRIKKAWQHQQKLLNGIEDTIIDTNTSVGSSIESESDNEGSNRSSSYSDPTRKRKHRKRKHKKKKKPIKVSNQINTPIVSDST